MVRWLFCPRSNLVEIVGAGATVSEGEVLDNHFKCIIIVNTRSCSSADN